jgi:hypothetical protein
MIAYATLLKEIIGLTPQDHPDYEDLCNSLKMIIGATKQADRVVEKKRNMDLVLKVQAQLVRGWYDIAVGTLCLFFFFRMAATLQSLTDAMYMKEMLILSSGSSRRSAGCFYSQMLSFWVSSKRRSTMWNLN